MRATWQVQPSPILSFSTPFLDSEKQREKNWPDETNPPWRMTRLAGFFDNKTFDFSNQVEKKNFLPYCFPSWRYLCHTCNIYFFNERRCVFHWYNRKNTRLGDHRQEIERKIKKGTHPVGLEHQHGSLHTLHIDRLDWDINTSEDALHTNDDREDKAQQQLHPTYHT
jgi:hypothetical protein